MKSSIVNTKIFLFKFYSKWINDKKLFTELSSEK